MSHMMSHVMSQKMGHMMSHMMGHVMSHMMIYMMSESPEPNPPILATFHWVVCDSQTNQNWFQQEERAESEAAGEAAGEDVCSQVITIRRLQLFSALSG